MKAKLANASLVVVSVLVFYAIGEFVFFRFMLPHMSVNIRPHIPDRADFFLQTSKNQYIPQKYIALVGDSYAQGMGDWLLSIGGKSGVPHHSADIIHDKLGRDVASFGRAAAGSAQAMVLRTTRILGDGDCYLFPHIETPAHFVVYFAESTDINDNVALLQHAIRPKPGELAPQIDAFLDRRFAEVSSWRCHGHFGVMIWRMMQEVGRQMRSRPKVIDLPTGVNRVLVNGAPMEVPELQVPSLALTDPLIEDGIVLYERSLAWLRRKYPNTPVTVVYIPSPAAAYRIPDAQVVALDVYLPAADPNKPGNPRIVRDRRFPTEGVYRNSQLICEGIRAASVKLGADFIDARPQVRSAAAKVPLHGPRDWKHFNEAGYRLLGDLVASRLAEHPRDACNDQWEPDVPRANAGVTTAPQ